MGSLFKLLGLTILAALVLNVEGKMRIKRVVVNVNPPAGPPAPPSTTTAPPVTCGGQVCQSGQTCEQLWPPCAQPDPSNPDPPPCLPIDTCMWP
ncbi:FH2 domain-containing protein 1 [Aplysia californica]|uniref:FH2 domain-containing protein 1 n=1 Tax=Aplysia californica TaxID=6500 RepID=A0ABM1AAF5_APLCA|nr:FH2 domain-containing protein 1 [Aplysia californica]